MLDVLQGFEYASDLLFGVLILLVYCCEFVYTSHLIHLQTLKESIFKQLRSAATLNKRDRAYNAVSALIGGGGLILGVDW